LGKLGLKNSKSFAADSLFCEWAYVINLDNDTLEIYKGFNTKRLSKEERFYYLNSLISENKYKPVKHVKTYKFSELKPTSTMKKLEKELE
jgi:hypothetical protein